MSRVLGVIPARWASTRFPGKILHPVAGRPLLYWVVKRIRQARRLDGILVATDDKRIQAAASEWAVETVLTDPNLPSGTDRVAAAIQGRAAEAVVNVQGDEPLIDPKLVDTLADAVAGPNEWDMATASAPIVLAEELHNPSVVKVVCDRAGRALYFSRAVIPHIRDAESDFDLSLYRRHIGIYAYRVSFLSRLVKEPTSALERAEKLEQLRALDIGARIGVVPVPAAEPGVDTPADIPRVEALLRKAGSDKGAK